MYRCFLFLLTLSVAGICRSDAQRGPVPGLDTATPYLIYYGNWTPAQVDAARLNYKLVILHPVSNVTAADVATIKRGVDNLAGTSDDVPVLAYISVGEDDRTAAPVVGDGTGPRVDPRSNSGEPLAGIDPLGVSSPSGTGFASYYLDDTVPDGQPDTNSIFGGPFVNAGDPAWYQVVRNNVRSVDGAAGLEEILTDTVGAGYGCDGVFLDTLDTPAPNSFGATLFEWTAPGFQTLLQNISNDYPDKLILGNRGIFFYNPNLKQYEFTLRPYLNMILFESYYTDSSDANVTSPFFDDNKFNWAPKLNAEANRADGFTILGLGYDHPVNLPQSVKDQDFVETMEEQGWPLYRTNGALNTVFNGEAATWVALNPDNAAPIWDSTAAFGADSDPGMVGNQAPSPRIGVQEVEALESAVTVRWDVARDQTGPVRYNVYYTDASVMDFNTATKLSDVSTAIPIAYKSGTGTGRFPYEATVTGLVNGTTYLFAVRAEDSASTSHEDTNTVTLAATPMAATTGNFATISIDGSFSDWAGIDPLFDDSVDGTVVDFRQVWIANDADFLYVRFTLETAASAFADFNTHLFVDADGSGVTGYASPPSSFGSEMMIELGIGYDQRNGGFNEGATSATGWQLSPIGAAQEFELRVALSTLYADSVPVFSGQSIRLLLQDNRGNEITGVEGIAYVIATEPLEDPPLYANITIDGDFSDWDGAGATPLVSLPSSGKAIDFKDVYVANDGAFLYGRFTLHSAAAAFADFNSHVFIDVDGSSVTGFTPGTSLFGSEVLIESGSGFDQRGGGFNEGAISGLGWAISPVGAAQDFEFRISRAALFADDSLMFGELTEGLRLLLQDNRGDSLTGASGVEFGFAQPSDGYDVWRDSQFTLAQLSDEVISGVAADPDQDGAPNLLEYALGMNPVVGDPQGLPELIVVEVSGEGYLGLRYKRVVGSGLSFLVEQSSDLDDWSDEGSGFTLVSQTALAGGFEQIEIRVNSKLADFPRNFLRLKVQR